MNLEKPAIGLVITFALLLAPAARCGTSYVSSTVEPPPVQREFRGAWVASVENIDWPSRPGLPVKQQKAELLAFLDCAVKLHLNAVVLQVRPECDALYASKIEPWSYYLTGAMGKAPEPFYDPLTFAVQEAHKRGLELHAWFNPYRAALLASKEKQVISAGHISRTHPEMVRKYGTFLWLDPGEKEVQDYSWSVVMDVVNRYDIDGVHFDDYFYPYREKDAQKRDIDFPDEASWQKYGAHTGLSRDDWRRENVNSFVKHVYDSIKATKPWVKFGIAPFGIWQPGYPPQISKKSLNAYEVLYCDSRKWLTNGWVDYCSPQLYWSIDSTDQSFPLLFKWWIANNPLRRPIWPGLDSEKVGGKWKAGEILSQIGIIRMENPVAPGEIQWSEKALMQDRGGLAGALTNGIYAAPALIPSMPWLERGLPLPGQPKMTVESNGRVKWKPDGPARVFVWVLQSKIDGQWHTDILPGDTRRKYLDGTPEVVALTPIDRCGMAGPAVVMEREAVAAK